MRITVLLNLISTIVIGVIVGKVFESIAFLVFYIPLRSYAGGYHASTPWRCYFISIVIIMEMLLFIGYVDLSIIYIILLLVGMVVCFAFAPVEDKRYVAGLNAFGERHIYTTRGVGSLYGLRLNCRPEVTMLELV